MITTEEAIDIINDVTWQDNGRHLGKIQEARDMVIAALREKQWLEKLWHDAKTDPPKTPGLYYGKKDDTNSMWLCQYRDGVWTLDMCPNQKMPIIQWAEYTSFLPVGQSEEDKPLTLEELREMTGAYVWVQPPGMPEHGRWGIVEVVDIERKALYLVADYTCHDYGRVWIAYRHRQRRTVEVPLTRVDRIRAMSDEELADFIGSLRVCNICHRRMNSCFPPNDLDWLHQPAEEVTRC